MSRTVQYNLVSRGDTSNITVVVDGQMYPADSNHASWDAIVAGAIAGDPEVVNLFDASVKAAIEFEKLSERIVVRNSRVFVDSDEVDDVYADQIVAFMSEGHEDWEPLVNFLELVYTNNEEHTRDNLSRWLKSTGGFEIDADGFILGYKGVNENLTSIRSGPGVVNGVETTGNLDNSVGNVVEMARSKVEHNPAIGCASGLHVGTYEYAKGFGTTVLKVRVNPRDVVSVPTDCADQKIRCSRYEVLAVVDGKTNAAYVPAEDYDDYDDESDYDSYDDYYYTF